MSADPTAEADRRLEAALETAGARDPREFYRERMRELREANPAGYEEAVSYYRDRLIPRVAEEDSDPLAEWTEYGRLLAHLSGPGRTVAVDVTGRALPYEVPAARDHLVLHLPDEKGSRAILVGLPAVLSPAQRATFDVLVQGKQRIPVEG